MRTCLFLISLLSAGLLPQATGAKPPNILVILVDDMGYGDLTAYNPESKIPTPHLDKLARDGMRFTDAHAPGPLCHLSRYGLLTGRYPFRANTGAWRTQPSIETGQLTVASLLKEKGYHTAMVGKWHLGFKENGYDKPLPGGPVDVGFQSFFGIRASTDIPPYFYIRGSRAVEPPTKTIEANNTPGWSRIQGAFWRGGGIAPDLRLDDVLPRFTREALAVIADHDPKEGNPLFLYLAYPAPHTPWLPSRQFRGKSGAGIYGEFCSMVDAEVGRVLQGLETQKMADDTLVIFTSDNGPVWYDVDVQRSGHDSAGGLRGMKADAWEAGHRMPFLVRWPGMVEAGSVTHHLVCFTDLLATFAELVNGKLPGKGDLDSESFLPVLTDSSTRHPPRGPIVMRAGSGAMMIRDQEWKLIDQLGSGGFSNPKRVKPGPDDPKGQLYNLSTDSSEQSNLWKRHPELVRKLTARMRKIVK
ncbi:MAG TPA: arylsulfatase [Verrucomicrobiales bacterium]|nr:arylsulfatase [Deltaproteobacteria bacterium]HAT20324.1 arylsulfatase [Verrucomicrobiales bacterium]